MPAVSVRIAAPAEHVWDLVADVTRMGRWSPETTGAEWLDGATGPAVGARFRGTNQRRITWRTTCTVTACERGRVFAFTVGKDETSWAYRFEPLDGGCEVTEEYVLLRQPSLLARWLWRPTTGVPWSRREADLVAGMEETLRRLAAGAVATVRERS